MKFYNHNYYVCLSILFTSLVTPLVTSMCTQASYIGREKREPGTQCMCMRQIRRAEMAANLGLWEKLNNGKLVLPAGDI